MSPRVIHISDLHLDAGDKSDESCYTIANYLIANRDLLGDLLGRPEYRVVVITGDLTDGGDSGEYEQARRFIGALINGGFQVYVTPGNHDYCKLGLFSTIFDSSSRKDRFIQYVTSSESPTKSAATPPQGPFPSGDLAYGYPRTAELAWGLLILLDSMQQSLEEAAIADFDGHGKLGQSQLGLLQRLVDNYQPQRAMGKKLIVCLHHVPLGQDPGWGDRLDDYVELEQCILGKVDCLLFGHTGQHCQHDYQSQERSLGIPLINSENLEDVKKNAGQPYPITVLDLGTYRRLVFYTDSNIPVGIPVDQSFGTFP